MLIPPERRDEEREILARIVRGEPIEHFETVRVAKDGRRIDISLTISPIRNASNEVIGASKIARDISRRKTLEARDRFLARSRRYGCDSSPMLKPSPSPQPEHWANTSTSTAARTPRSRRTKTLSSSPGITPTVSTASSADTRSASSGRSVFG